MKHDQKLTVEGIEYDILYCNKGRDVTALIRLLQDPDEYLDFDTETTGLMPGNDSIRLVQIGHHESRTAWEFPFDEWRDTIYTWLYKLRRCHFITQNGIFDYLLLSVEYGELIPLHNVHDTMLLAHHWDGRAQKDGGSGVSLFALIRDWIDEDLANEVKGSIMLHVNSENEKRKGEYDSAIMRLKGEWTLAKEKAKLLKQPQPKWKDVAKPERPKRLTKDTIWREIAIDDPTYIRYAGLDVIAPSIIYRKLRHSLENSGFHDLKLYDESDLLDMQDVIAMGFRGLPVDAEYFENLGKKWNAREVELCAEAESRFGITKVNATKQVAEALLEEGMKLTDKTDKGALQVNRRVLENCMKAGSEVAPIVSEAKRLIKWQKAYAGAILKAEYKGKVHPQINPLGAATGRESASNPPLQQMPSATSIVRDGFFVDVSIDYSGQEMRAAAMFSGDPVLIGQLARGENPMKDLAAKVFGPGFTDVQKGIIKVVIYATLYSGGVRTIAAQTGQPEDLVKEIQDAWYATYKRYRQWNFAETAQAKQLGYVLGFDGRVMPIPRIKNKETGRWKNLYYTASNRKIQNFGSVLMKGARRRIVRETPYGENILLTVHDEMDFNKPADGDITKMVASVVPLMERTVNGIHFPVEVTVFEDGRWKGKDYEPEKALFEIESTDDDDPIEIPF